MKDLYKPDNEVELSLIKSIFDSEGIHYYVLNDNFGSLYIGLQIDLYNSKTVRVHENDFEKAKELLTDFLGKIKEEVSSPNHSKYTFWDQIRIALEAVLFGWIVPRKKKKSIKKTNK